MYIITCETIEWERLEISSRKLDSDVQSRILDSVGEGEGGMF